MYSLQPKLRSDTPSSQYALYSGECIHAFGKNRTVASPRTWICYYELGGMRYQALTGFDMAYTKDMQKQSLIIGMINMRLESTEKEITN